MRTSPNSSADSRVSSSVWREIAWFQLVFAIASGLTAWSITGYTNFWWPLVVGAALHTFIAGNLIVVPLYAALHRWRGGGLISRCLAVGVGGPLAWLLVSFANKSIAQGSVVDSETGQPIDLFAGALDWTVAINLLLIAADGIVAVLVVWGIRLGIDRFSRGAV